MSDDRDTAIDDPGQTGRLDEDVVEAANAAQASSNPHVDMLARTIGARPPGSDQENDAVDYLIQALGAADVPAARLRAAVPRWPLLPDIIIAGAALVATIVAVIVPALGMVMLIAVLALHVAETLGYIKLSSYVPATDSANVLSIVSPAETEVRRLIVTSTLDSGTAGVLAKRHMSFVYSWLHALVGGAIVLSLLTTLIMLVDSGNNIRLVLIVPALLLAISLALLVERQMSSTHSPGAISNASGVAAMVEIARTTASAPPRWLEVWFLGVGASTAAGGGMRDFLSKNTFDPDTTYFVHLQSVGAERLIVPRSVGAGLRTAPATPLLTWIFDSVRPDPPAGESTDQQRLTVESLAQVTHRAGYQSVVVAGVDERRRVPYLDHDEDLPYKVNEENIDEAARLVALAIDALDREVAARAMLARSTASVRDAGEETARIPVDPQGLPTSEE